jgi:hypothetical protein
MAKGPTVSTYRQLAAKINAAMSDVPSGWQAAEPAARARYGAKVERWQALMSELYDPLYAAHEATIRGDATGREALISFLEADVYCHRSGYFKADAIKALTRRALPLGDRSRLTAILIAAITGPDRREFRSYVRLARALDSPVLRAQIEALATSDDARTARHARWVLEGLSARPRDSDILRDELVPLVLRLLKEPEAWALPGDDLGSLLARTASEAGEPYRTAFQSLAKDLESTGGRGISAEHLAAARKRFEAALKPLTPRDSPQR